MRRSHLLESRSRRTGWRASALGEILLAAVREAIYRRSHPSVTRDLRIIRSELAGSAEPIGAAALALDELFDLPRAREWVPLGMPRLQPSFVDFLAAAKAQRRRPQASPPSPAP